MDLAQVKIPFIHGEMADGNNPIFNIIETKVPSRCIIHESV
jgi:hypothetical protein